MGKQKPGLPLFLDKVSMVSTPKKEGEPDSLGSPVPSEPFMLYFDAPAGSAISLLKKEKDLSYADALSLLKKTVKEFQKNTLLLKKNQEFFAASSASTFETPHSPISMNERVFKIYQSESYPSKVVVLCNGLSTYIEEGLLTSSPESITEVWKDLQIVFKKELEGVTERGPLLTSIYKFSFKKKTTYVHLAIKPKIWESSLTSEQKTLATKIKALAKLPLVQHLSDDEVMTFYHAKAQEVFLSIVPPITAPIPQPPGESLTKLHNQIYELKVWIATVRTAQTLRMHVGGCASDLLNTKAEVFQQQIDLAQQKMQDMHFSTLSKIEAETLAYKVKYDPYAMLYGSLPVTPLKYVMAPAWLPGQSPYEESHPPLKPLSSEETAKFKEDLELLKKQLYAALGIPADLLVAYSKEPAVLTTVPEVLKLLREIKLGRKDGLNLAQACSLFNEFLPDNVKSVTPGVLAGLLEEEQDSPTLIAFAESVIAPDLKWVPVAWFPEESAEATEAVEVTITGLTPEEAEDLIKTYSKKKKDQVLVAKTVRKDLGPKSKPVLEWSFASSSTQVSGKPVQYTTMLHEDGTLSCNCPGWILGSAKSKIGRFCKHTKALEEEAGNVYQKWTKGIPLGEEYTVKDTKTVEVSDVKPGTKFLATSGTTVVFKAKRIVEL